MAGPGAAPAVRAAARPQRRPHRRRWRLVRPLRLVCILCLAVGLPLAAWWRWARPQPLAAAAPAPAAPPDRLVALLLGVDTRPGDPGRADAILLAAVDFQAGAVDLLSIPRDTFAYIPGHGWDKLNAAYSLGGAPGVVQAVAHLTGVPVTHYAAVDMQGLRQAVDRLGGVDIRVDAPMHYEDPYDTPPLAIHFEPGTYHMNGQQALLYARFRADAQADRGRMARQQEVLRALARAALQPANAARLPGLAADLIQAVHTDLPAATVARLAAAAARIDPARIRGTAADGTDYWTPRGYFLAPNLVSLRAQAYRMVHGREPDGDFLAAARQDAATLLAALDAVKRGTQPGGQALGPRAGGRP